MTALPPPHGGRLTEPILSADAAAALKRESRDFPSRDIAATRLDPLEPPLGGVGDPCEAPPAPELVIDTAECMPMEAAQPVPNRLEADGYLR